MAVIAANKVQPDSAYGDGTALEQAILRTLLYADVFGFPMNQAEIHHFLIECSASPDEVSQALRHSPWLLERIQQIEGYYVLRGRGDHIAQRQAREIASQALWPVARRYGVLLAHLPFVRMVALTGALAMHNANGLRDDIDYMIVTEPGRVWMARAFAILVVRIVRLLGVGLCPNYVLAETALVQSRQDLFIAHELAQMVPLTGIVIYERMRAANDWSAAMLPNAQGSFYAERDQGPRGLGHLLQRAAEWLLAGRHGDLLENWERRRKERKFNAEAHQPGASAEIDAQRIKGHFKDYGYPTLDQYRALLEEYNLLG
jgi:hypothetical protein